MFILADYHKNYEKWLYSDKLSEDEKDTIRNYSEDEKKFAFSCNMSFGTAGLRAKMGLGTSLMNTYTVAQATEGIARLIKDHEKKAMDKGVVIGYDCRNNSTLFAYICAEVLSASGIKAYIYESLRPTPMISFAIKYLNCTAGINITASHNTKEYNGYKVYWDDGIQISPEIAEKVASYIDSVDIFEDVPGKSKIQTSLIQTIGPEVEKEYINKVLDESIDDDLLSKTDLKVVYTPLHGAGAVVIPKVLKRSGLKNLYTVNEEMQPNGYFPTVKRPNPEFDEAYVCEIGRAHV